MGWGKVINFLDVGRSEKKNKKEENLVAGRNWRERVKNVMTKPRGHQKSWKQSSSNISHQVLHEEAGGSWLMEVWEPTASDESTDADNSLGFNFTKYMPENFYFKRIKQNFWL